MRVTVEARDQLVARLDDLYMAAAARSCAMSLTASRRAGLLALAQELLGDTGYYRIALDLEHDWEDREDEGITVCRRCGHNSYATPPPAVCPDARA